MRIRFCIGLVIGVMAGLLFSAAGWTQSVSPVAFYAGGLALLVLVAIFGSYARKVGRAVPWRTAIRFCALGLASLARLFGAHVLLPAVGYTLLACLTVVAKGASWNRKH